jgi:hypothetical protein
MGLATRLQVTGRFTKKGQKTPLGDAVDSLSRIQKNGGIVASMRMQIPIEDSDKFAPQTIEDCQKLNAVFVNVHTSFPECMGPDGIPTFMPASGACVCGDLLGKKVKNDGKPCSPDDVKKGQRS